MDIIKKIQDKQIDPKVLKKKLANIRFQAGRNVLIKGLPAAIRQGYKEQEAKGNKPTVISIFADISRDNLECYHEMEISYDYIKEVIQKVIDEKSSK